MKRRSLLALGTGAAVVAGLPTRGALAQNLDPVKIGVPMPLTGPLSQAGQLLLQGIQYGAKKANDSGGFFGRKLQLLVEDTKSEPNTAAVVAAKMATQDRVWAFVGGYGSTSDFALLQGVRRYAPIFIHAASSSVRLEQTFGAEPWYHHVYIWDYHRQKAASRFFDSITPRPKRIALAYEDGLYGSDAAKYSNEYMSKAGFEIVMREPFKAGSPDFSPILNRVKALDPDVFFVVAYSGDNIQIARQAKSLGVRPKLMLQVAAGEKRSDFADFGPGIAVIGEWAPEQKTEGNAAFIKEVQAAVTKGAPVTPAIAQGYTAMQTLVQAVRAAGSIEREAVLRKLGETTFNTPYGPLKYRQSEGGAKRQLLTDETMVVVQYRDQGQDVVWPANKASGKLVYPNNR